MLASLLGWVSTVLVLIGFGANASGARVLAIIIWILGDLGWIAYDLLITNYSHMFLSIIIIFINSIAIFRLWKN
tara:strand:- start:1502 stop:1723 length:222 start_codon:yes stop_codon:yes gene_type:complete